MSKSPHQLNRDLALALGLPKSTTRAVLTLQAGEMPRLEVEFNERPPRFVTDPSTGKLKLATVQFMLRLEPFTPTNEDPP
jgi:hypothetical protein